MAQRTAKRNMAYQVQDDSKALAVVVKGARVDAGARDFDKRSNMLRTPTGESAIAEKEDALEQIMCVEAWAGFEQVKRHQLSRRHMTRCCADPDRLIGLDYEKLEDFLDPDELNDDLSDSDGEMMDNYELGTYQEGPGEPHQRDPLAIGDLRIGIHCSLAHQVDFQTCFPQDRTFVARCGEFTLAGLCHSHGRSKVGYQLAQFIADEMPRAVFRSQWLTRENDPVGALSGAFHKIHRKAIEKLDLRLTGASCTVIFMDPENIWVAHAGDCKVVLGVPDQSVNSESYHFTPLALSEDHKLAAKSEFDRVMSWGGDVRHLVGDTTNRLFLKDRDVPGIILTRSIGDRVAHSVGLSHMPAFSCVARDELPDGAFLCLGSGGLWATMSERNVVNWVSRYSHSADEAAEGLAAEAKRRWEDPARRHQATLAHQEPDAFSVLLLYPGEVGGPLGVETRAQTLPVRPFAVGAHQPPARREWKEVKQISRLMKFRRMQKERGRGRAHDGSAVLYEPPHVRKEPLEVTMYGANFATPRAAERATKMMGQLGM